MTRRDRAALGDFLREAWQPFEYCGWHDCELCPEGTPNVQGWGNLFIPAPGDGDLVYAAPQLIGHYVEAHGYRPPREFLAAVRLCPDMRFEPYLLRMARHRPDDEDWCRKLLEVLLGRPWSARSHDLARLLVPAARATLRELEPELERERRRLGRRAIDIARILTVAGPAARLAAEELELLRRPFPTAEEDVVAALEAIRAGE